MVIDTATAEAPAKAILFGEHSVNRGQSALATSVGLHVRCTVTPGAGFTFTSGAHTRHCMHDEIRALRADVDAWRAAADYAHIQALARAEYFAPAFYVLANAFDALPDGLTATWHSAIPDAGGLGSGGASAVAFATALLAAQSGSRDVDPARIGPLAYLGDVIAHGGVASALDTQTALHGGVIRYTQAGWGERIDVAPGLTPLSLSRAWNGELTSNRYRQVYGG